MSMFPVVHPKTAMHDAFFKFLILLKTAMHNHFINRTGKYTHKHRGCILFDIYESEIDSILFDLTNKHYMP